MSHVNKAGTMEGSAAEFLGPEGLRRDLTEICLPHKEICK